MVQRLVKEGANIEARDKVWCYRSHGGSRSSRVVWIAIKQMMKRGINVEAKDKV